MILNICHKQLVTMAIATI